ncbi:chorismate mutase [Mesobacillus harenae]|uniref:chorismate mutase n=1 Tax=Mesobacillus harenae TaxID=2213203 RepID=UPI001580084B|nr:chorismate mutase [Mesobacillus harenae]
MIRGVRGAITINQDTAEEIVSASEKLLRNVIDTNKIKPEEVTSVFISVTDDVTAAFPARALRLIDGWTHVPVMCMKEIPVPDSLPLCIRVMMHVHTEQTQSEITHVYLEGAKSLRPDLSVKG